MPTFTALIAHDTSFYGEIEIEAATQEEAIAIAEQKARSGEDAVEMGEEIFNQRVCHLIDNAGDYVLEDHNVSEEVRYKRAAKKERWYLEWDTTAAWYFTKPQENGEPVKTTIARTLHKTETDAWRALCKLRNIDA